MRGSLIPNAKRLINRTPPINPTDLSEANADNYMFLFDNVGTGEYLQDSAVIARHLANLRPREQATPNLTLEVIAGSATFQTIFVAFAGGNSPSFTAPVSNPRIDLLSLKSDGTLVRTAGAENASPVAPSVPVASIPLCSVYNVVGQTVIHDNDAQIAGQGYILQDLRPFLGIGGGVIKSIQQGTIDIVPGTLGADGANGSGTATITAVDTTKAHVIFLGLYNSTLAGGGSTVAAIAKVELTNATTITANLTAYGSAGGGGTFRVGYVVVEYF